MLGGSGNDINAGFTRASEGGNAGPCHRARGRRVLAMQRKLVLEGLEMERRRQNAGEIKAQWRRSRRPLG